MKCPLCGVWTTVLETRGVRRRRECGNGTTAEGIFLDEANFSICVCKYGAYDNHVSCWQILQNANDHGFAAKINCVLIGSKASALAARQNHKS